VGRVAGDDGKLRLSGHGGEQIAFDELDSVRHVMGGRVFLGDSQGRGADISRHHAAIGRMLGDGYCNRSAAGADVGDECRSKVEVRRSIVAEGWLVSGPSTFDFRLSTRLPDRVE